ncbi:phosphonatase-like hydrolase [Pedobacter sp. KR3-3]|uniref:Phosphonatase-like hydrolase n=1 Tax=Pedobacter albus TaxID=3113905 RepID=A0ABU7I8K7_9SPHI|nr:phosphonatase-like hydrolase [Pedobacter sp. KR3-3]MEE1945626.1 phosphonatase-like hydrolase [Pedobacter sp. KR3-3]
MTNIKLAVFDMAGTTVDEDNMVYKTVQKVINQEGFDLSLAQVLAQGAGKEKYQAIIDILTAYTQANPVEEIAGRAFDRFKPTLEAVYNEAEIKGFEGVEALFAQLKAHGIKVVLNTGYDLKTATKLLQKLNWKIGEQVDALITADDVTQGRPHPDMIQKAMQLFGIADPQQVLKAGDSEIDILEGKNAHCGLTIGVLSGAQTKAQLQTVQPDYILERLTDLPAILQLS